MARDTQPSLAPGVGRSLSAEAVAEEKNFVLEIRTKLRRGGSWQGRACEVWRRGFARRCC